MPADAYFDKAEEVKDRRKENKQKPLKQRHQLNQQMAQKLYLLNGESSLSFSTLAS
jgi:hypothetical protein